jgi:hypothetical protein
MGNSQSRPENKTKDLTEMWGFFIPILLPCAVRLHVRTQYSTTNFQIPTGRTQKTNPLTLGFGKPLRGSRHGHGYGAAKNQIWV